MTQSRVEPAQRQPEADFAEPVVVGLDGSDSALLALDWAVREARVRGCGLELVYAHPDDPYAMPVSISARDRGDAVFEVARRRLSALKNGVGEVTTTLRRGPAPRELVDAADRATMLVVGREGAGRLSGVVPGSTSLACAMRVRVPLTIVPSSWEPNRASHHCVVVGVDGSSRCAAAVEYAFDLAAKRGARIIAVHAVDLPAGYPMAVPLRNDVPRFEETAAHVFASSLSPWRDKFPGVDVTTATEYGHPAAALAEYAAGADLAVVGGRGHGLVTGMLLGSVARAILRRMPVPVTVVHDADRMPKPRGGRGQRP